jgi:FdrA protein
VTRHVQVRPGAYADSVTLLAVSRQVAAEPGVAAAQVAMATPLNLDVLAGMGFDLPASTPNDMVVALRLDDDVPPGSADDVLAAALVAVDAALAAAGARHDTGTGAQAQAPARTTGSALRRTGSTLALVSVPGGSAFVEAMDAVDAGRDVMIFSDNVPVHQEVALKRAAERTGSLVMGPDCGTAVIGGAGLGFANVVRPGPVGIVAASGTGCQQVLALLDHAGVGVSAALGVGGRDLSAEVGGLSTRRALRVLDADPATELVLVVSKPPAPEVADGLEELAATLTTPVRLALLGPGRPDLTTAVEQTLAALGRPVPVWPTWGSIEAGSIEARSSEAGSRAGRLRGLYVGGTLCGEAGVIAAGALGPDDYEMVDFGADDLTVGRAHPMIDPTLRLGALADAVADPATAVLLLDVVLGHGAQDDPAADLTPSIGAAHRAGVPVVVACVGTAGDPQDLGAQADALAAAGAQVFASNAAAARHAVSLLQAGPGR